MPLSKNLISWFLWFPWFFETLEFVLLKRGLFKKLLRGSHVFRVSHAFQCANEPPASDTTPFQHSSKNLPFPPDSCRPWKFVNRRNPGMAGRGRNRKCHDNLRQSYDKFGHSLCSCDIICHKNRHKRHDNLVRQPLGLFLPNIRTRKPNTLMCLNLPTKAMT